MKTIHLCLYLFSLFFGHLSLASTDLKCGGLWTGTVPDDRYTHFECTLEKSGDAGGGSFQIYHYSDGWPSRSEEKDLINEMSEAFSDTANILGSMAGFPNVAFFLTDKDAGLSGTDAVAFPYRNTVDGYCPVFVYQKLFRYSSPAERKQVMAHEVIHCYQMKRFPKQMMLEYKDIKWWAEGSAVYLSNYIYPDVYADRDELPKYRPEVAINLNEYAYSLASFFHSVSNNGGDIYAVFGLLQSMPKIKTNDYDQINAFNDDVRSAERFHTFAREFVDNAIKDFGGRPLATNYPGITITVPMMEDSSPIVNEMEPYTFKARRYTFPKGAKFVLRIKPDFSSESRGSISYRKTGTKEWTTFNPFGPLTVDTSCSNKEASYDFVISASGKNRKLKNVIIDVEYNKIECPCKDKYPLDSCLIGKWRIENSSLDNMFSKIYGSTKDLTYLGSSGEMNIGISVEKKGTIDVPGYDISVKKESTYNSPAYTVGVNLSGAIAGDVGIPEIGKVCFKNFNGAFKNVTTLASDGYPPVSSESIMEMPTDSAGVSPYQCSGSQLKVNLPIHLHGYENPPENIELIYDRIN